MRRRAFAIGAVIAFAALITLLVVRPSPRGAENPLGDGYASSGTHADHGAGGAIDSQPTPPEGQVVVRGVAWYEVLDGEPNSKPRRVRAPDATIKVLDGKMRVPLVEVVANGLGEFQFDAPQASHADSLIVVGEWTSRYRGEARIDGWPDSQPLTLILSQVDGKAPRSCSIRVLDHRGVALQGAQVEATVQDGAPLSWISDSEGRIEFDCDAHDSDEIELSLISSPAQALPLRTQTVVGRLRLARGLTLTSPDWSARASVRVVDASGTADTRPFIARLEGHVSLGRDLRAGFAVELPGTGGRTEEVAVPAGSRVFARLSSADLGVGVPRFDADAGERAEPRTLTELTIERVNSHTLVVELPEGRVAESLLVISIRPQQSEAAGARVRMLAIKPGESRVRHQIPVTVKAYRVHCAIPGFHAEVHDVSHSTGTIQTVVLRLRRRGTAAIHGLVNVAGGEEHPEAFGLAAAWASSASGVNDRPLATAQVSGQRFALLGLQPSDTYTILVRMHGTEDVVVRGVSPNLLTSPLRVRVRGGAPKVEGLVSFAESGRPLARATLVFKATDRADVPRTADVEWGKFSLPCPPGTYHVEVRRSDIVERRRAVTVGSGQFLRLEVEPKRFPAVCQLGLEVRGEDGEMLPGSTAKVFFSKAELDRGTPNVEFDAGPDGRVIAQLAGRPYAVRLEGPAMRPVELTAAEAMEGRVVVLKRAR